jgi:hypothetical protein
MVGIDLDRLGVRFDRVGVAANLEKRDAEIVVCIRVQWSTLMAC